MPTHDPDVPGASQRPPIATGIKAPPPAIFAALDQVQRDLPPIPKGQRAAQYAFRGIDDLYRVVGPLLTENSVVVVRRQVLVDREEIEITTRNGPKKMQMSTLRAEYAFTSLVDGSSLSTWGCGQGSDDQDKGLSGAISTAFKYVLTELFTVPTEEQRDGDHSQARRDNEDREQGEAYQAALAALKDTCAGMDKDQKLQAMKDAYGVDQPAALKKLWGDTLRAGTAILNKALVARGQETTTSERPTRMKLIAALAQATTAGLDVARWGTAEKLREFANVGRLEEVTVVTEEITAALGKT